MRGNWVLSAVCGIAVFSGGVFAEPAPTAREKAQKRAAVKRRKARATELRYEDSPYLSPASEAGETYRFRDGEPVGRARKPKKVKKKSSKKAASIKHEPKRVDADTEKVSEAASKGEPGRSEPSEGDGRAADAAPVRVEPKDELKSQEAPQASPAPQPTVEAESADDEVVTP